MQTLTGEGYVQLNEKSVTESSFSLAIVSFEVTWQKYLIEPDFEFWPTNGKIFNGDIPFGANDVLT